MPFFIFLDQINGLIEKVIDRLINNENNELQPWLRHFTVNQSDRQFLRATLLAWLKIGS